jgi:polyketide synthase PksN
LNKDINNLVIGELNYQGDPFYLADYLSFNLAPSLKDKADKKSNIERNQIQNVRLKGKNSQAYSQIEKDIAQVWSDVLGYEEIDVNDNFFDLGGDSLSVVEVHSKLIKKYPDQISVVKYFSYPTIANLAEYIKEGVKTRSNSEEEKKTRINRLIDSVARGEVSLDDATADFWDE